MTISKAIIKWYQAKARKLPWRDTKDPYLIWVSEIIMQQTRVEQGLDYYLRFIKAFPNAEALNQSTEDQVLKLWQGLGYYSRARNMKFAAKQIIEQFKGVFPSQHEDIIKLKGIGAYTAAAIASFSFDLPYAVVDGNVFRVLARYYGIDTPINTGKGQKEFSKLAQEILNPKLAATHNQAIMEFGALLCKPKNPKCADCPLSTSCIALASNTIAELPKKEKKLKVKNKYMHFFLITDDKKLLIEKRDYSSIWKGLYQLPLIETENTEVADIVLQKAVTDSILTSQGFHLGDVQDINHKLTHRNLHIRFYEIHLKKLPTNDFFTNCI